MRRVPVQFIPPISRNPDISVSIARGVFKKYVQSNLNYADGSGRSDSLWLLSLRITHRCNHRCAICGQWGKQGYNARDDTRKVVGDLPLEVYKRVIDDVAAKKVHVYITGGEPFLYQSLVPLTNYIVRKGLTVQIVTNGIGLKRHARTIVGNGWDMLCVSLDGPKEIHDKCRGLPGAFDIATEGIREIQKVKRELKRRKPALFILTTISKSNESVLAETIREAEKLKPDGIVIYYSWFTTESIGKSHTKIVETSLGITPFAWKGYVRDTSELDIDEITSQVRSIKSEKHSVPIMFVPEIELAEIPKYYHEPENFLGWRKCLAPWFQVDVMPNGDVVNCRDFPDFVTGNIIESSILDIYNGEKHRAFRRALRRCENGVFPLCSRCCGLMGY